MAFVTADDHIWVELTYTGGDMYGSHCKQEARKARLVFLCDTNVPGLVSYLLPFILLVLNVERDTRRCEAHKKRVFFFVIQRKIVLHIHELGEDMECINHKECIVYYCVSSE